MVWLRNNKPHSGLSLIGVLVATFILVTGVIAATQLVARTRGIAELSQQKFVATNLAREGLELVQAKRDDNWLDHQWWQTDLCQNQNLSFVIDSDPTGPQGIHMEFTGTAQPLYQTAQGLWTHRKQAQQTPLYSRLISVRPFIWDVAANTEVFVDCNDPADPAINGLEVTSTVTWQRRGQAQQVVLKEKLYDWHRNQ